MIHACEPSGEPSGDGVTSDDLIWLKDMSLEIKLNFQNNSVEKKADHAQGKQTHQNI